MSRSAHTETESGECGSACWLLVLVLLVAACGNQQRSASIADGDPTVDAGASDAQPSPPDVNHDAGPADTSDGVPDDADASTDSSTDAHHDTLPTIEPHCDREWVINTAAAYVELVESECEIIPSLVLGWWDDGSDPLPEGLGRAAVHRVTGTVIAGVLDLPLPELRTIDGSLLCDYCSSTNGTFLYPLVRVGQLYLLSPEIGSLGPLVSSLSHIEDEYIHVNAPACEYARLAERLAATSPHVGDFGGGYGTDPSRFLCGTWDTDCDGEPEVPEKICGPDEQCVSRGLGGGFDCQPRDDGP